MHIYLALQFLHNTIKLKYNNNNYYRIIVIHLKYILIIF